MVSEISSPNNNNANQPLEADDAWTLTLDIGVLWRGLLLIIATFISHWQAIGGGFIWDDDAHVTRIDLRSLEGLWNIWFKLGATQQYYPLLHSIFWFEHAIWGDAASYYHVVNILFHTIAALLLVAVLRRLEIPGAWIAGFIFALHPVHVESVAWITEQKNTISAIFYFLTIYSYIKYDQTRNRKDYWYALAFFVLALLSKTVTATLPAALLVIFWWKRGKLSLKDDVYPLLPFFVLGAIGGIFTAWVERVYIGAHGSDFLLTPLMRCLLAGHVIWFYFGKLLLPANLIFIYQHWTIDASDASQYFYPMAVLAAIGVLFWFAVKPYKGRAPDRLSRAPLAGFLFFCGTLFPVLGFANVYPFMFSYVADHFQYLASLGILVPLAAGLTLFVESLPMEGKGNASAIGGVCIALLGFLSWNQCSIYKDGKTLYLDTLAKNPMCWMAHNNLGAILLNQGGDISLAQAQFEEAIKIRPPYADAQANLSTVLLRQSRFQEAIPHGYEALRLHQSPENENNLAIGLAGIGRTAEAVSHYEMAVKLRPNYVEALNNLGNSYMVLGRKQDALNAYQTAVKYVPTYVDAYVNIGFVLMGAGHPTEGLAAYEQACKLSPASPGTQINLANAYSSVGRFADALVHYQEAIRLNSNNSDSWYFLGNCLINMGKYAEAEQPYLNSIKLNPNNVGVENNLAAVCFKLGRMPDAIGHYEAALKLNPQYAEAHNNLGVALAASKMIPDAIAEYKKAIGINPQYADAFNKLGLAFSSLDKNQEAMTYYKQAITINNKNPEYHDGLSKAFKALGKNKESADESAIAANLRNTKVEIPALKK